MLETNTEELSDWFRQTEKFTQEFLLSLKSAPAYQVPEKKLLNDQSKTSFLVSEPMGYQAALYEVFSRLTTNGIDTAGGRYFGYIPGGGLPVAAFGDFIAALTNRYAGMYHAAPGAVGIENDVLRGLIELFHYPPTAWGTLTSGGSIANLTGILAARQTRHRCEWENSTIYLTEQSHKSVQKALKIAGLNPNLFREVSVDSNFRMDPVELRKLIEADLLNGLRPWIVIAAIGTTNTGSIDPISELIQIKKRFDLWLHVDAAYGGFFRLLDSKKDFFQGVEEADSLVLDPHKGLFMPYGSGALLVREGAILKQALTDDADYLADLADAPEPSPADYSPELTRHFRGLRIYLSLKTYGIEPFKQALNEKLELTQWTYQRLKELDSLEFACGPELSLVVFRVRGEDRLTQELLSKILARGKVHLSSTRLHGKLYLRFCILGFRSHFSEVQTGVQEIYHQLLPR